VHNDELEVDMGKSRPQVPPDDQPQHSYDPDALAGLTAEHVPQDDATISMLVYISDLVQQLQGMAAAAQLSELARLLNAAALQAALDRLERQAVMLKSTKRGT
jgi:hypothetical protein